MSTSVHREDPIRIAPDPWTPERDELFRTLAEAFPDLLWLGDASTLPVYLNPAWTLYTGLPPEELRAAGWDFPHHPDDLPQLRAVWAEALERGEPMQVETRIRRYDGVYRWFLCRTLPVKDRQGRIEHWVGILTDIEDRKRAEDALADSVRRERERAAELEGVMRAAPIPILVAHDARCAKVTGNPAMYRLLQIPDGANFSATPGSGQHPLRPFLELRDGRPLPPQEQPLQVAAARGVDVKDAELTLVFDDGSVRHVYGNAVPVRNEDGTVRGAIGAFMDVTAIKEAVKALEDADTRKDEFLATLAHELRNPLAPIRNALEYLRLTEPYDPQRRAAREIIERQVRHMTRLVDDLLDVSRITSGKITLRKEHVTLAVVVTNAVEASRPAIDAAGQTLAVELPEQPVHLDADVARLTQVLQNLLNNAAKYSRPGGRITVSAAREGGGLAIRVRDTGIGIPPEMLSRVFEMFTQVDRPMERTGGGLGIGLTLVQRLVELHGGTVEAHSGGADQGSEFVVRLPMLREPAAEMPEGASPAPEAGLARRRILVVDDNVDSADSLATLLTLTGHEVRTAYDGGSALSIVDSWRPDLVLLDLGMSGLSGYEVCRRLRQRPAFAEVPIVAMTGWGSEADRRRSQASGFSAHLTKPVDPAVLSRLVASADPAARQDQLSR